MTKIKIENMFARYLIILTMSNLGCFSNWVLAEGRFKRLMKSDRYTEAKEHAEFKRNKHSSKATANFYKQQPKADAWQERAKLADDKRNDAQQKREKSVNDQLREHQLERLKKADDRLRNAQQKAESKIKAKRLSEEGYPMPRPLDKTKRYVPHPNDRGSPSQD
ncbi:MAG: hypothetical protein ABI041_08075 [Bdellovibrionia bacterium]